VKTLDPAPARVERVSPATWVAGAVLLLVLGALALFLLGCDVVWRIDAVTPCPEGQVKLEDGMCAVRVANHYPCECDCIRVADTQVFAIAARIRIKNNANVRDNPAGTVIGQQLIGQEGTAVAGPQQASNITWWQVDFDTGVDGWVDERFMVVLETVLSKPLDVCLPAALNENVGGTAPAQGDLDADCSTRVATQFQGTMGPNLPPGSECRCAATGSTTAWDSSCDAPCSLGVCVVPGSDPAEPTPDPLATTLLSATSVCEVTGTAEIHVGDEVANTSVSGVLQIHGTPCAPGQSCQVGVSYQLRLDDITIPVRFHSDPKFVDLGVSGASEPGAVTLGPFLGPLFAGELPTGATLNSVQGRREGSDVLALVGRNAGPLSLAVDWENKHCLLDGDFISDASGGIVDDDGHVQRLHVLLTVGGTDDSLSRLVNQPPRADAGPDQTVECTSADGAPVSLTAAASTDADGNIAYYMWRRGSADGTLLADPSANPALTLQQAGGETTYHVRAVDRRLAVGDDDVKVDVVDTTPPDIDCHAATTIAPPDPPVSFTATATDLCGPVASVVIEKTECLKVTGNGAIDPTQSCKVVTDGATLTIRNSGGVGTIIRWVARATDAAGNVGRKTCEVSVANPAKQ
jgi:hypothetical protein